MAERILLGNKGGKQGLWISKAGVNVTSASESNLIFSTEPPNAQGSGVNIDLQSSALSVLTSFTITRDVVTSPLDRGVTPPAWSNLPLLHSKSAQGAGLAAFGNAVGGYVWPTITDSSGSPAAPFIMWQTVRPNGDFESSSYWDWNLQSGPSPPGIPGPWARDHLFAGADLIVYPDRYNQYGSPWVSGQKYGGIVLNFLPKNRTLHVIVFDQALQ